MKNDLTSIVECIKENHYFTLVSHVSPDGDNIGSMISLGLALQNMGKDVILINSDLTPSKYDFMTDRIPIANTLEQHNSKRVTVYLDCTDSSRVGETLASEFSEIAKEKPIVNIDHHISNTSYGELNLIDPHASATGEIVYYLLQELNVEIDQHIATAIYTAIMTDTGSFRYQNTTGKTLRIASELLDLGANLDVINESVYETVEFENICFLAKAIAQIDRTDDGQICWIKLKHELIEEFNYKDTSAIEGLVGYTKSVAGVKIGILFTEMTPGVVKISFRSKGDMDVNQLASKFGGGGHQRAAGCKINGALEKAVAEVIAEAQKMVAR
ncbi:phosphoesterase RecJ-like protein [Desulfitispora alkaliphila]|uniref:DHH family phosphoesterase n=1 Tax=Desulfitispora alkaliphila TaxID=622674 RepID=UPI003D1CD973